MGVSGGRRGSGGREIGGKRGTRGDTKMKQGTTKRGQTSIENKTKHSNKGNTSAISAERQGQNNKGVNKTTIRAMQALQSI